MRFFGPPDYHPDNHTVTPVGAPCNWCGEKFINGDKGVAVPHFSSLNPPKSDGFKLYHEVCNLRLMVGSIGHQQKKCSCFGGDYEDPPELTLREAAQLAVDYFVKPNKEACDA